MPLNHYFCMNRFFDHVPVLSISVQIWDLDTGDCLSVLTEHQSSTKVNLNL